MGQHEDKCALLRKYYTEIATAPGFYIKENIPSKSIDNAIKKFASGLDRKTIIGFYDTTITENGKGGYIFTDTKVVYRETMGKPKKFGTTISKKFLCIKCLWKITIENFSSQ